MRRSATFPFPVLPLALTLALAAVLAVVATMATPSPAAHAQEDADWMTRGEAKLTSAGALAFAPDGTLFVGDSEGAAVWAIDVGGGEAPAGELERIPDLDSKIAARLGVDARDVFVKDLAVHPATREPYLSVMRGAGDDARPVLLRVTPDGGIHPLDLSDVRHARLALGNAPAEDATVGRRPARPWTVTDLELVDGELFIAGLSNEEFASTLRRAPYPFRGADGTDVKTTGLEIYHGAHGAYETHAPIFTFMPVELGGETHILASYLCTPLVSFPLEEVRGNERLRGKTLAELGYGNVPIDMLPVEKDGEPWVLLTNTRRGTMRLALAEIEAAQKRPGITREVGPRTGVDYVDVPAGSVVQAAPYDDDNLLLLRRELENGSLVLGLGPIRWI